MDNVLQLARNPCSYRLKLNKLAQNTVIYYLSKLLIIKILIFFFIKKIISNQKRYSNKQLMWLKINISLNIQTNF